MLRHEAYMKQKEKELNMANEIPAGQRKKLLNAHNKLKNMLNTIHDISDLYLSDIRELESIIHMLHTEFKFDIQRDEDGNRMYYADWVFEENVNDKDV